MDPSEHAVEFGVFGIGLLLALICLPSLGGWVWVNTLPASSPTTSISFQERVHHGKSSTTVNYIEVGGVEYPCRGSVREPVGALMQYDPSTPSRCRAPENVGSLVMGERFPFLIFLFGLGAMVYAVVSFFFLNDGRDRR